MPRPGPPDDLVKDAVLRMIPPRPGGEIEESLLNYQPGQGFGAISYEEPVRLVHELGDDQAQFEEIPWTRMSVADRSSLNTWRDHAEARRDARRVLSEYLTL